MWRRDLVQKKRQRNTRSQDRRDQGDLHEHIEQVVNANRYRVQLVLLVRCLNDRLAKVQFEECGYEAKMNNGKGRPWRLIGACFAVRAQGSAILFRREDTEWPARINGDAAAPARRPSRSARGIGPATSPHATASGPGLCSARSVVGRCIFPAQNIERPGRWSGRPRSAWTNRRAPRTANTRARAKTHRTYRALGEDGARHIRRSPDRSESSQGVHSSAIGVQHVGPGVLTSVGHRSPSVRRGDQERLT